MRIAEGRISNQLNIVVTGSFYPHDAMLARALAMDPCLLCVRVCVCTWEHYHPKVYMANQCTKFEVCIVSRSMDI